MSTLLALLGSVFAAASAPSFAGASAVAHNPVGKFLGVVPNRTAAPAAASASPPPPLTYHGGPVQHSSRAYAIFWIPPSYALPSGYQTLVTRYFTDVAHDSFRPSNVYAPDTQFFDTTTGTKRFASYLVTFGAAVVDTRPLPPDGCPNYLLGDGTVSTNCITDAQIEDEIGAVVAAHHYPTGLGAQYFLFTPQGLASCFDAAALAQGGCYDPVDFDGYCAYHSSTSGSPSAVLYANMPYAELNGCSSGESPNGNAADAVINVTSHEHNETITDPLGSAWFDSSGMENGDKCLFDFGTALGSTALGRFNQVINGHDYWLQQEWTNRTSSCVLRNTYPQPTASWKFSPAEPAHGTKVKFTSVAHDSDDTVFTYRWTFPDGTSSTLANPTHSFRAAGSKRVGLIVFDPHGDQVRVVHNVPVR